jgi:ribonuclease HII
MPDYSLENTVDGMVCGVDEAGRGPCAGPVVAAAVILDSSHIPEGLDDSKKLTAKRREALFSALHGGAKIGFGLAEPEEIDRLNILQASMVAMRRAVIALNTPLRLALIDGNRLPQNLPCAGQTVIGGDGKSLSIAAASIMAKVMRDRLMVQADALYPAYGFARHKGYQTVLHKTALARIGPCPIHRYSYAPVKDALNTSKV